MQAAFQHGVSYVGENALPRFDAGAYQEIEYQAVNNGGAIQGFTYLRLSAELFQSNNWNQFAGFVSDMHGL